MMQKSEGTSAAFSDGGGIEIALSGVVFGLLGLWLDSAIGTTPAFFIVGFLFGFIGSSISFYYRYKHKMAQLDSDDS